MGKAIGSKKPCTAPGCTSSDGKQFYDDGSATCFVCRTYFPPPKKQDTQIKMTAAPQEKKKMTLEQSLKITASFQALPINDRCISQRTCEFYGYVQGNVNGKEVHVEAYRNRQMELCAHKYRLVQDKKFMWAGDEGPSVLYGQHLWAPNPNITIVVTEGAFDALSIAEIQACKWPVVSIKGGVQSAYKELEAQAEYLNGFKSIILCFDNDEPGKAGLDKCLSLPLFEAGKLRVARLPLKDANDMLKAGRIQELTQALWAAQAVRPDYIVVPSEVSLLDKDDNETPGYSLPYPELELNLRGLQRGRAILLAAGPGMGKSTLTKELAYHLVIYHGCKIGNIFLEESLKETRDRYIALDNNVSYADMHHEKQLVIMPDMPDDMRIYRERYNIELKMRYPSNWQAVKLTQEQRDASDAKLFENGKLILFNHSGVRDLETIISRINYLAVGEHCDLIILDNMTKLISMVNASVDDRKAIDIALDRIEEIKHRTGVGFILVTQLSKDRGKERSFNEGARVTLSDLRGSQQLASMPDYVVALEGDQQNELDKRKRLIRLLKGRVGGETGAMDMLEYDPNTGRLKFTQKTVADKIASGEISMPPLSQTCKGSKFNDYYSVKG